MTQALRAFSYGHGGLGVALLAVAAGCLLLRGTGSNPQLARFIPWLYAIVCASALAEFVLTTGYLFSPAYVDHVEASVASNVNYFLAGLPLYPSLDSYRFNGLLYGPLLTEINSLGYVVPRDSFSAKIIGWLAGWLAVGVLVRQSGREVPGPSGAAALIYSLAILFSFGADLTVDRSEPLLLLIAVCSMAVALNYRGLSAPILLGLLCGAAAGLKLHAPLYVLPSVSFWAASCTRQQWQQQWRLIILCFCAAACIALVLPFLPANVSIAGYGQYLALAARHGLTLELFGRNCAFMLGLWAPILLLARGLPTLRAMSRTWQAFALTVLAAECLVLIIASKPGAGIHHFIPFVVPHLFLFRALYSQTLPSAPGRPALALGVTVLGMITPTMQTYDYLLAFDLDRPQQTRQRDELLALAARFPGGMLGVANNESYELANFRPWLTARGISQTDYGAFMDLELSGVTDAALASAFASCTIPFLYVPKPGLPFTLRSYYRARPLFSDTLRKEFDLRYVRRESGAYFDVFACRPELRAPVP